MQAAYRRHFPGYGYRDSAAGSLEDWRDAEHPRLAPKLLGGGGGDGVVYLDHAGATLFADSQLTDAMAILRAGGGGGYPFGSPHSSGPSAEGTQAVEAEVRARVLRLFNAKDGEYDLVFTSGATAALKLVADHFPFSRSSVLAHSADCHTSALGVRAKAAARSAAVLCLEREATAPTARAVLQLGAAAAAADRAASAAERLRRVAVTARRSPVDTKGAALGRVSWWMPVALCGAALSLAFAASVAGGGWKAGGFVVAASNCAVVALLLGVSALGVMADEDSLEERAVKDGDSDGGNLDGAEGSAAEHLLVIPAECNFDGVRHCYQELSRALRKARVANKAPQRTPNKDPARWWVLVDAAKLAATSPLDLGHEHAPDMVVLSFYKLFGYPTGEKAPGANALALGENSVTRGFACSTRNCRARGSPRTKGRCSPPLSQPGRRSPLLRCVNTSLIRGTCRSSSTPLLPCTDPYVPSPVLNLPDACAHQPVQAVGLWRPHWRRLRGNASAFGPPRRSPTAPRTSWAFRRCARASTASPPLGAWQASRATRTPALPWPRRPCYACDTPTASPSSSCTACGKGRKPGTTTTTRRRRRRRPCSGGCRGCRRPRAQSWPSTCSGQTAKSWDTRR